MIHRGICVLKGGCVMKKNHLFQKLFAACALAATCAFAAMPSAEAGIVGVHGHPDWRVNINDSSVYMVSRHHAHVIIAMCDSEGWMQPYPVSIRWSAGFECYRIDQNGNYVGSVNDDVGLAVANYMSANY